MFKGCDLLTVFLVRAQVELIITVVLSPQTSDNELSKSRTASLQRTIFKL